MNTYYELTHLPRFIYEADDVLVILPIFFTLDLLRYCNDVESCAHLFVFNWDV